MCGDMRACGTYHNKGGVGVFCVNVGRHPSQSHFFIKNNNSLLHNKIPTCQWSTIKLMEPDKNPMPYFKLELLPRTCRVFHFIFDHLQSAGLSDHDRHNTGGGPALDKALYDQQELDYGTLPE